MVRLQFWRSKVPFHYHYSQIHRFRVAIPLTVPSLSQINLFKNYSYLIRFWAKKKRRSTKNNRKNVYKNIQWIGFHKVTLGRLTYQNQSTKCLSTKCINTDIKIFFYVTWIFLIFLISFEKKNGILYFSLIKQREIVMQKTKNKRTFSRSQNNFIRN